MPESDFQVQRSSAEAQVTSLTDEGLVAAAQRGDMRAFERLYRRHSPRVMGLCVRMCRQRDLAEDCTQATFVRAWRNLKLFEGRSAFTTWLHRIAVNEVLGHLRNHGTRAESDSETVEAVTEVGVSAHTHENLGEVMDVEGALSRLPEGARHVVVLQAVYGYSHEEVADMLGIAVGTCKAQLHRARALLRERLGLAESAS
jgi:RNA polymerase sigma-70 factor (ECF subfamily)